VHGILKLFRQGEERLVIAVETGRISLTAAVTIVGAGNDDSAVEAALQEAYESGKLRGNRPVATINNRQSQNCGASRNYSGALRHATTSNVNIPRS